MCKEYSWCVCAFACPTLEYALILARSSTTALVLLLDVILYLNTFTYGSYFLRKNVLHVEAKSFKSSHFFSTPNEKEENYFHARIIFIGGIAISLYYCNQEWTFVYCLYRTVY